MNAKTFQYLFYAVRLMYPDIKITARLPLAISKLETGNWLKNSYTGYKNLFGMTAPNSRETTATNAKSGKVATFSSAYDSMRDFFLWCRCYALTDDAKLSQHVALLKYNTNPAYPGSVDKIVHQLDVNKEYLPAELFALPVVAAGAGLSVAGLYLAITKLTAE